MRAAPLARALAADGHEVFLAARDFANVAGVFAGSGVRYLPAPYLSRGKSRGFRQPLTFAHILHNVGFGDDDTLGALTSAWRNLFELARPDVIVCDHSPSAMLAARGLPARVTVMGTGFCIPPDLFPMPNLRPWIPTDAARLIADEIHVLARVNNCLRARGQPPLHRLGQLYSEADETFLMTYGELDHYDDRPGTPRYWGPSNGRGAGGAEPQWPPGAGRRVFAYLKNTPHLPHVMACLAESGLPTLAFIDGMDEEMRRRPAAPTVRFAAGRLDAERAARACDLAVTHGTFGTTAMMLAAGKPVLMLPLVLEQGILARKVERLGAGRFAPPGDPAAVRAAWQALTASDECARAADALSTRLSRSAPEPAAQLAGLRQRVTDLTAADPR
jgi:UDP:flavonoid glycosyltransferase YjiC (YdhE family)